MSFWSSNNTFLAGLLPDVSNLVFPYHHLTALLSVPVFPAGGFTLQGKGLVWCRLWPTRTWRKIFWAPYYF